MDGNGIKEKIKKLGLVLLVIVISIVYIPLFSIIMGVYYTLIGILYIIGSVFITFLAIILFLYYITKGKNEKN